MSKFATKAASNMFCQARYNGHIDMYKKYIDLIHRRMGVNSILICTLHRTATASLWRFRYRLRLMI